MTLRVDLDPIRVFLTDTHLALAERASLFADETLAERRPTNDDEARSLAREFLREMGQAGLLDYVHPLDLRACCLLREVIAHASPLADEVFALQALGSMPIALAGSDALKAELMTDVKDGKLMAAFAMTEPEAGSDVAALRTRAERNGGGYVLTGEKTLISNAGIADFYTLFASTDPSAGHRGISCFVVPASSDGLLFAGAQVLSAPHPLGGLVLDRCRVEESRRLGKEGDGFKLGMQTLDSLRTTVGAAACGMARRALDEALNHVTTRRQFGAPLAELQLVQARLAQMAVELTAARLLVYRAALAKDSGKARVSEECAMAKLFATEAAQRVVDSAVQLHGGSGVLADSTVDQLYRAVRPLRIYEGATDVQYLVIARALLARHAARA
ncbi:MAG: acyl-CoA dehydrogenase family protein [Polyangiaceae bacterium]